MDEKKDADLSALLLLAQDGDKSAYARFLGEASELLKKFLLRRMENPELVEDVLQDTLLSVHRARHTFQSEKPLGPWLYAICEHRMLDFYRKYRRLESREIAQPDEIMEWATPSPEIRETERGQRVLEALERLPANQREVITLLKIEELTVKEIAKKIGISESSVKVTAFRGYETIRRLLGVGGK